MINAKELLLQKHNTELFALERTKFEYQKMISDAKKLSTELHNTICNIKKLEMDLQLECADANKTREALIEIGVDAECSHYNIHQHWSELKIDIPVEKPSDDEELPF